MSSSELTINGLQEIEADDITCDNITVNGDITVFGDQIFNGNATVSGDLTINGTINGNNTETLSGNLVANSMNITTTASASSFSGNGANLTNLNAANITSGILPIARGGIGIGAVIPNKVCVAGAGGTIINTPTNLHWDNTNFRLGIRTETPQYELDVSGTALITSLRISGNATFNNQMTISGLTTINSKTTINNELVLSGGINGIAFTDRLSSNKNFIMYQESNLLKISDYGVSQIFSMERPSGNTVFAGSITSPIVNASTNLNFSGADYRNAFSATGGLLTYNGTGQYGLTTSTIRNLISASSPISYDPSTGVISASSIDSSKWEQSGSSLRPKTSLNIARVGIGFTGTVSTDSTLHLKNVIDPSTDTKLYIESSNPYGETIEFGNSYWNTGCAIFHEPDPSLMVLAPGANRTMTLDENNVNISAFNNSPALNLQKQQFGTNYNVAEFKFNNSTSLVELTSNIENQHIIFKTTNPAKGSLLPTEAMRLTTQGNLGIGTQTGIDSKLTIFEGDIRFLNTATGISRKTARRLLTYDTGSTTAITTISQFGTGTNGYLGEIEFFTKGYTDTYDAALKSRMKLHGTGEVSISENYDITKPQTKLTIGQGEIIKKSIDYIRPVPEWGRGFNDTLYLWEGSEYSINTSTDWYQRLAFRGNVYQTTVYWNSKWNGSFMFEFYNMTYDNTLFTFNYTPNLPTDYYTIRLPVDKRCDNAVFIKVIARDRWGSFRAWLCNRTTGNAAILLGEAGTSGVDSGGNLTRNSSFIGPNNCHARANQTSFFEWLQFNIPMRYMLDSTYVDQTNNDCIIAIQSVYGMAGTTTYVAGFASCANPYSIQQRRTVEDTWRRMAYNQTVYAPTSNGWYNEEWLSYYNTSGRYIQFLFALPEYPTSSDWIITFICHNNTWESLQCFDQDVAQLTPPYIAKYPRRGGGPVSKMIQGSGIYRQCFHFYLPASDVNAKYQQEHRGAYLYQFRWLYLSDVGVYTRGYIIERANQRSQNI